MIIALTNDCERINWQGERYYYCEGVFYKRYGSQFVVVYPPFGLRMRYRPYACNVVNYYNDDYCYHYGVYYHWDRDLDFYVVVRPPSGLVVSYLPYGFEEFRHRGLRHYRYGGVHYRPHYRDGIVIYITIRLDD